MPQDELVPTAWRLLPREKESNLALKSLTHGVDATFTFEKTAEDVFRITFTSPDHPLPPWPSVRRQCQPEPSNISIQTDHHDLQYTSKSVESSFSLTTVDWSSGVPIISVADKRRPSIILHHDLPHRSYVFDGQGVAHYTRYNAQALHTGLGEKAAPMDLSNRHFILSTTDCFGYDAFRTDPLYKHIPLLITATQDYAVATFSTSHDRGTYSVGSEIDGMWGRYKVYRQDHGGLEEYLIIGSSIKDVVHKYAELAGYPLLVPRWAFGYIAGGMKYSMLDEPPAHEALMSFAEKLKKHDIPCSGFQLSSGYTVAETEPKTRNVFTWNKHRFPSPQNFVREFLERGIKLIANVKPYILASHPEYERLRQAGAFFMDDRTGKSAEARLWSAGGGESGIGGHIDFTSRSGYDFWFNGVQELRQLGIACIWNDNNEFTISSDKWQCALDSSFLRDASASGSKIGKDVGLWGRYLHTELMGKTSHDAVLSVKPNERPFILTRAATAGTMRFCASSWSGDNVTSWSSMKGANALSLTASHCLLHCYGHDIGGFEGPQPSPELLLRWVQLGIHSPRFAINCFKTSQADNSVGDVIEPWMYPEITQHVRKAIKRRYELIPYLYSLHLRSHLFAEPPQRWVGWDHAHDDEVWTNQKLRDGEEQYFLGDCLIIGGVYEPNIDIASVYLPQSKELKLQNAQYLNLNAPYQYFNAGQWVSIKSEWRDSIPILAKVGTLIPVGRAEQVLSSRQESDPANLPLDDYRAVELFPPPVSDTSSDEYVNSWLEDDGISPAPTTVLKITLAYRCIEGVINITKYTHEIVRRGKNQHELAWKELHFLLPVVDDRIVNFQDQPMERCENASGERPAFRISVARMLAGST